MAANAHPGSHPGGPPDYWRLPTLLLWAVFFAVGLAPATVYAYLRQISAVVPQRALVNSEYSLTLALAAYLTLFCYQRGRETGMRPFTAQDKAFQLGVISLIAFVPFNYNLILTAHINPYISSPALIYGIGAAKIIAWLYLLGLFLRYYARGNPEVFTEIPSMFPSTRKDKNKKNAPPASTPQQPNAQKENPTGEDKT